jgi:hypothetical protein
MAGSVKVRQKKAANIPIRDFFINLSSWRKFSDQKETHQTNTSELMLMIPKF